MMLIYSREDEDASNYDLRTAAQTHGDVMSEAATRGIFRAADALQLSSTATVVRRQDGNVIVTDGPFAETREQIAGYYILDCESLDEAIAWAVRIPTSCHGAAGCVEVRPIREIPKPLS